MNRFVPLKKRSKKAQRAYYRTRRGTWHEFSPVTRVIPNKKHMDRDNYTLEDTSIASQLDRTYNRTSLCPSDSVR